MGLYCGCGKRKGQTSQQCHRCAMHTKRAMAQQARAARCGGGAFDDRPIEGDLSAAEIDAIIQREQARKKAARWQGTR